MASLIAKSPCEGLVPVTAGGVTLDEELPEAITSVAPFKGKEKAVAKALVSAMGAGFPAPGQALGKAGARVVWSGLGQALVLGPRVAPEGAAVTDQSDAWAVLSLQGPGAREVLARLLPLDLRDSAFPKGASARTLLGHMSCLVHRTGETGYQLLVFRSMAKTAVHEIAQAMDLVAARG